MLPTATADLVCAAAAVAWALLALSALRAVLGVPRLEPRPEPRAAPPRVSVVVPARDEAARIEETVRRLLDQADVAVEVVVVDDRSRDATGALVAALAERDARVRLVRVAALPPGWLGKPHACQRGGEAARGDWLLFTDGDVHLAPDVLARAVALGAREDAQHVVLVPGVARATWAARAVLGVFSLGLLPLLAASNRDARRGGVGIGAFNLVRADAWRAIGGHAALAYEVVDDIELGRRLRRGGFRTRARLAQQEVVAEWGATLGELLRLLEKNHFAFFGYRAWLALLVLAALSALWLSGPLGAAHAVLQGGPWGWAAFAGWLAPMLPTAVAALRAREPLLPALGAPLAPALLLASLARSMTMTLRRGGVLWRGTLYPLAELRARRAR